MACTIIRNKETKEIEKVLAPNGQESKLYQDILKVNPDKEAALRSWAQVYTPSFKQWFGDWEKGQGSKVVDKNGEPLLVYHGTGNKFNEFDKELRGTTTGKSTTGEFDSENAFFFTTNPNVAFNYAILARQEELVNIAYSLRVITSNLSWDKSRAQEVYNNLRKSSPKFATYIDGLKAQGLSKDEIMDKLKILEKKYYNLDREYGHGGALSNPRRFYNDIAEDVSKLKANKNIILNNKKYNSNIFKYNAIRTTDKNSRFLEVFDDGRIFLDEEAFPKIASLKNRNITTLTSEEFDKLTDEFMRTVTEGRARVEKGIKEGGFTPEMMPVFLNARNVDRKDFKGEPFVMQDDGRGAANEASKMTLEAIKSGKDGVVFENIADPEVGTNYGVFEPNQIKSVFNEGAFSKETGNIYNQLTSKEVEGANKNLNEYLTDFLKPFGVQVRDFEEYKKRTGQDGLGATDVLNKLIYLSSQSKIDTMPEEAAHMAIMLMGEKHPDIDFLLDNIQWWSEYDGIKKEYFEKYEGNEKMIKLEAIAKLISKSIVGKYKETGGDRKLIQKALDFINSFFNKIREIFLKKNAFYSPMGYGVHLADKIAINMLAGNTNYVADLKNSKKALSYDEALENNSFAKSIIDRYTKGMYKFKLVGSLAIAGQGENIYRPSEEPIHDLDFIVSNIEDYNSLVNHMSDIGAERVHNGWENKSKGYTTYAYYIPAPGHTVNVISRDRRGWVSEYKLLDANGKEVKPNANNIMATDFFVYYNKSFEESVGIFSSWQDIYNGKLGLSKAEGAERMFQREKDQRDYVLSQPVSRERQLKEFTYLQKEQQSERPSNEILDKKIKNFLASIGVSVGLVDEIRDREGNLIDAVAKADMLNRVIQVVNGQADITTLSEEAAHFFVELLGENNPLYKDMVSKITSYALYSDVVSKYKDSKLYRNSDGTINFDKLKKEAMGKLIMQHIIEKFDDEETAKRIEAVKSWWNKAWEFIKKIFSRANKVNEQVENPFAQAAKQIIESDVSQLDQSIKSEEEYLQINSGDEAFRKVKDFQPRMTLDDSIDPATGKKRHIYKRDGEAIVDKDGNARSVNENVVKPWYKQKFPTDRRTDIQKAIDELKAEMGTDLHAEIDRIIKQFIDSDTGLLLKNPVMITDPKYNEDVTKTLNIYMRGLLNSYPPGTRFMSEVKILDEKRKIPGTIDLVVFLSDGSADIYDWKSQELREGETELKWFKEPAYRLQLEEYRKILEKQFGITAFNKIRAIPMITNFKYAKITKGFVPSELKTLEIGPVDPSNVPEGKDYLLPVVAQNESTGNIKLDELVSRLNAVYEMLANSSTKDKERKNLELNKLSKTIRSLQVKKDMKSFVESGLLEIEKYHEKLINNDISIGEVLEAQSIMNVYVEGSVYLKTLLLRLNKQIAEAKDDKTKEDLKKLQDNYKSMTLNARDVLESLKDRAKELGDNVAKEKGIKGLLSPERVMDFLKRNFRSLSSLSTAAAQTFYKLLSEARQRRDIETEEMNEELAELREKLETWASQNGISKDKIFDGILEMDKDGNRTGDFLSIYSDEFRKLRDEAIRRGDTAWIRANMTFDREAYEASFTKYKELVESYKYSSDPKLDREKKDKAIMHWIETHNGEKSDIAALSKKGNYYKPNDVWWSEKYKKLNEPSNAPLKAVYNHFQKNPNVMLCHPYKLE